MSDYIDEVIHEDVFAELEKKIPKWFDKEGSKLLIKALRGPNQTEIMDSAVGIFEEYLSSKIADLIKDFFEETADLEDGGNVKESLKEHLVELEFDAEDEEAEEENKEKERYEKIKKHLSGMDGCGESTTGLVVGVRKGGFNPNDFFSVESVAKDLAKILK